MRLRPLVTRALCLLVRRRGRLVSRAELRRELWGEAILEWEPGLHQVIRQLRRALGDDAREPAYVETVPRRGYRFKARIEDDCSAGLEATRFSNDRPDEPRPSRSWGLLLFLGGVLSVPLVVVLLCVVLAV